AASAFLFWLGQVQTERERQRADEQRQRAETRSNLAQETLDEMYLQAQKWLSSEPWPAPDQTRFLERALAFYERFAQEELHGPEGRQQTAKALHRIARIRLQLRPTYRLRGKRINPEPPIRQAISLLTSLVNDYPDESGYLRELAVCEITRGGILKEDDPRQAAAAE